MIKPCFHVFTPRTCKSPFQRSPIDHLCLIYGLHDYHVCARCYITKKKEEKMDVQILLSSLSSWIDNSSSYEGISEEAHLVRRCIKAGSEVGEMIDALYGHLGENPRKGITHTLDDVIYELLDIALAALGAVEHINNNQGTSLNLLEKHIKSVVNRAIPYGLIIKEK